MFKENYNDTRSIIDVVHVFILKFENISHLFLVSLLFTLNKKMFAEQGPISWE